MKVLGRLHQRFVYGRRIRRLSELLAKLIPPDCSVLDVGCGDAKLSRSLLDHRPDLQIEGVDVLLREHTCLPVKAFDGAHLPYAEKSFDAVMLIDVLHHTESPMRLLQDVVRVSKRWLVIKDHYRQGIAAGLQLRFMDYVGNSRFGVALPYNYLSPKQWTEMRERLNLRSSKEVTELGLYPVPLDYIFGRDLHFIALWERLS
jgi:SAM-dependent methyltransferase